MLTRPFIIVSFTYLLLRLLKQMRLLIVHFVSAPSMINFSSVSVITFFMLKIKVDSSYGINGLDKIKYFFYCFISRTCHSTDLLSLVLTIDDLHFNKRIKHSFPCINVCQARV